jgi:hypothetical protein
MNFKKKKVDNRKVWKKSCDRGMKDVPTGAIYQAQNHVLCVYHTIE